MKIILPNPSPIGTYTLYEAIKNRRSCRDYSNRCVSIDQLSLLLWSTQGSTGVDAKKTTPSAGAQYPMKIFSVIGNIDDLPVGLYQYQSQNHELRLVVNTDIRPLLYIAALDQQPWINDAALIIVLAANFNTMRDHFYDQPPVGGRGDRYVFLESGAIVQNVYLQATASSLGAVLVGGFDDDEVIQVLALPEELKPVAFMCVGAKPATRL